MEDISKLCEEKNFFAQKKATENAIKKMCLSPKKSNFKVQETT